MAKRDQSPAQRKAWRHNASIGQVVWAIKALGGIAGTTTLTPDARRQLSVTLYELHKLQKALATRKDD